MLISFGDGDEEVVLVVDGGKDRTSRLTPCGPKVGPAKSCRQYYGMLALAFGVCQSVPRIQGLFVVVAEHIQLSPSSLTRASGRCLYLLVTLHPRSAVKSGAIFPDLETLFSSCCAHFATFRSMQHLNAPFKNCTGLAQCKPIAEHGIVISWDEQSHESLQ